MSNSTVGPGRRGPRGARIDGRAAALWCGLTALGACATSPGERAFSDGHYQQAADAFAAELKRDPTNRALHARLDEARLRSIDANLARAGELRSAGQSQAAVVLVGRASIQAEGWGLTLPPDTEQRMTLEIQASDHDVREQVDALLAEKSPLAARALLDRYRPILTSTALRPTVAATDRTIHEAGRVRCAELINEQPEQESPYWHLVLGRYCAAVGSPRSKTRAPGLFKGLRVTIHTKNQADVERHIVEDWLAEWFRHSVWYSDDATDLLPATVENDFDAGLEKRRATLHASYVKHRTSTIVDETRILATPHEYTVETEEDFVYSATLYVATYHLDAVMTLDLAKGLDPFVAHLKADDTRRGYDHDVSFPPANIRPQRPNLLSAADWLKKYLDREVKPLAARLDERWSRAYCGVTARTLEGAARCLLAGQPSAEAAEAIRKKLVKDAAPTLHLFGGPATEDAGDDTPGGGATGPKSPAPKIETVAPARESTI